MGRILEHVPALLVNFSRFEKVVLLTEVLFLNTFRQAEDAKTSRDVNLGLACKSTANTMF